MASLAFQDVVVAAPGRGRLLDGVSFTVGQSEILGLTGETGAGLTLIAAAALGLLPRGTQVTQGRILLDERPVQGLSEEQFRTLRGQQIGGLPAGAGEALNPAQTIGTHLVETVRAHGDGTPAQALDRGLFWLERVGVPAPDRVAAAYPGELSRALRQHAAIAMALCREPALLILEEPIDGIDATAQAGLFALFRALARERGTSVLLITRRLAAIAGMATRAAVLYAGRLVEIGRAADVLQAPRHPYTQTLVASVPALGRRAPALPARRGGMPAAAARPPGCEYHPRCPMAFGRCRSERPPLQAADANLVTCWLYARLAAND